MPLGHGSHVTAFSALEKRPLAQSVHALLSTDVPGLQVLQYPADAPPQPCRTPAVHGSEEHWTQAACPVAFWKKPVGQLWQTSPLLKRPTSHLVQNAWPPIG